MAYRALAVWSVGYAVVVGLLLLTHLGRPPDERLPTGRFAAVLVVTTALPVLFDRELPVGSLAGDPTVGGLRTVLVGLVFPAFWGFLFGTIGLVAYAVASGLPDEPVER